MNRFQSVVSTAVLTTILLGTSCRDDCACVTVAPSRTEHWSGASSLGDSLDFTLNLPLAGPAAVNGSGHVRLGTGAVRTVDVAGSHDGTSPEILTLDGWTARTLVWRRTSMRADSVFGSVGFLGPSPVDTMMIRLTRRP
jgi:hypothetical protein